MFFGTFDESTHPRVQVLREGLAARGATIDVCNVPLNVDTALRVRIAQRPWEAPRMLLRILRSWWALWRMARTLPAPDVVVVGYLGHFDVHLARRLFDAPIVLDFLVALGDTARDRRIGPRSPVSWLLDTIDRAALRTADVIVVDTEAQRARLPDEARGRSIVVAVGAPELWFRDPAPDPVDGPLRVVFFGLFTPLQGTPVIGRAIARLADDPRIAWTIIGTGQDYQRTRALASPNPHVTWLDWLPGPELARMVAEHHVCLGIFGTSDKAWRVVPNKLFQGAAAGCAVVSSDTPSHRELLGDDAVLVAAGDDAALAAALLHLAEDRDVLTDMRRRAGALARREFSPAAVVAPLEQAIEAAGGR
ncbi:glycosyltransferase [Actinomarinicola tropica]|uniref:Glycosyltransferase n=1 Tax=Actinomarinicola tropica TaxID=2789776 RepID=A0A5Q2RJY0_9ACTN|nr:glycosyltransferase [Actinomarinicola tropica]